MIDSPIWYDYYPYYLFTKIMIIIRTIMIIPLIANH